MKRELTETPEELIRSSYERRNMIVRLILEYSLYTVLLLFLLYSLMVAYKY